MCNVTLRFVHAIIVFKVAICNLLTGIEENYRRTGEANKRLHKVIL